MSNSDDELSDLVDVYEQHGGKEENLDDGDGQGGSDDQDPVGDDQDAVGDDQDAGRGDDEDALERQSQLEWQTVREGLAAQDNRGEERIDRVGEHPCLQCAQRGEVCSGENPECDTCRDAGLKCDYGADITVGMSGDDAADIGADQGGEDDGGEEDDQGAEDDGNGDEGEE